MDAGIGLCGPGGPGGGPGRLESPSAAPRAGGGPRRRARTMTSKCVACSMHPACAQEMPSQLFQLNAVPQAWQGQLSPLYLRLARWGPVQHFGKLQASSWWMEITSRWHMSSWKERAPL